MIFFRAEVAVDAPARAAEKPPLREKGISCPQFSDWSIFFVRIVDRWKILGRHVSPSWIVIDITVRLRLRRPLMLHFFHNAARPRFDFVFRACLATADVSFFVYNLIGHIWTSRYRDPRCSRGEFVFSAKLL